MPAFLQNNLVSLIVLVAVFVSFIVLAVVLMRGRGTFLIAGYNTMSPEEKAKWNIKALGRAVGLFMLFTAFFVVGVTVAAMAGCDFVSLFWIPYVVLTVVFVVYINKSHRFQNQ